MKNKHHFELSVKIMGIYLFNIMQRLHHHVSDHEIELIKKTGLFNHLSEQKFKEILHTVKLVKYAKDALIFQEGDLADALYIIVEGSVRVFTYDIQGNKIPLARLNAGDYFGEQAILGEETKVRNASIEAISDVVLIHINASAIVPLWREDHNLKLKLRKIGYEQALHALSLSTNFYCDLKPVIEQIENKKIIELSNGETIFNFGDQAKDVYFILKGKVKLTLPAKDAEKNQIIVLNKGHLFGELGVLENKTRQATATADGDIRLLVIDGDVFKTHCNESAELKKLLFVLKHIYQLPRLGIVEQYIGSSPEIGTTLTSIFKMDDGRTLMTVRSLSQDFFTMSAPTVTAGVEYKFQKGPDHFAKLFVSDKHIVRIEACGEWEDLPQACKMMLVNQVIEDSVFEKFSRTGEFAKVLASAEAAAQIICTCMSVSRQQIMNLIDKGINDFDVISSETGASSVCGSCRYKILSMLGSNPWVSAVMRLTAKHNHHIYSYIIESKDSKFKSFMPGQFLVIQARIRGNWIERSYTLSNVYKENEPYRITIKKEPKGLFTQWLFEEAPDEFEINVAAPQGEFILNKDLNVPALCFAGGVGITPFAAFVNDLMISKLNKKLHILYCALTKNDFILSDEFDSACRELSDLNITYRPTDIHGLLTKEEIVNLTKDFPGADIYICGPQGFTKLIHETLQSIHYDPKKIHIEEFVHAGARPSKT